MWRLKVPRNWIETNDDEDILSRIVTSNKSWVYEYDPETNEWVLSGGIEMSPWMCKATSSGVLEEQFLDLTSW